MATDADRLLERVESLRRGQPARAWQVLGRGFGIAKGMHDAPAFQDAT